jgi:2-polyprenyl-6-hydroxyphenyl methylase/3-demethylubiquinone-9 3-methyltransferase
MTTNSTVDSLEVTKFAQLAAHWWDHDGPLKTLHDINPARLSLIQNTTSLTGQRVLDVGCGGGILSEAMATLGASVTGLDVGPDAIECARQHAAQEQLSVDYVCQPIETFDAELFDGITCMEMLEHVQEPELVIQHCARLLKKGGYLFLSTLNRTVTSYATAIVAAEYLFGLLPRQTHDFSKFIKPSELARMVRASGLDTVQIKGLGYNPITGVASLQDSVDVNYFLICQKR